MGRGVRWFVLPGVSTTFAGDGAMLLDIKKGTCYRLNLVATRLWLAIDAHPEGVLTTEIVDVLGKHFPVARDVLERDAGACLDNLLAMSLVRRKRATISSKAAQGRT